MHNSKKRQAKLSSLKLWCWRNARKAGFHQPRRGGGLNTPPPRRCEGRHCFPGGRRGGECLQNARQKLTRATLFFQAFGARVPCLSTFTLGDVEGQGSESGAFLGVPRECQSRIPPDLHCAPERVSLPGELHMWSVATQCQAKIKK